MIPVAQLSSSLGLSGQVGFEAGQSVHVMLMDSHLWNKISLEPAQKPRHDGFQKESTVDGHRNIHRQDVLTSYTEHDILQGRGKGISKHRGNQRFREIIKRYTNVYANATSNQDRKLIVDRVLSEVHEAGRFLEPCGPSESTWVELSEKKIREKVSQALRYQQRVASSNEIDSRSSGETSSMDASIRDTSVRRDASHLNCNLLGPSLDSPTKEEEEDDAIDKYNEWHETGGTLGSKSIMTDEEILAAIGANHLARSKPIDPRSPSRLRPDSFL